ncbi:hypothetical protein ACIA03_02060 [Nocardioides sp. NPDC051685]|uniref:hypothetical protein n=1 Tax=Nocardioides sp. NPDC051685 TaxID=3364334 RepID=UPI00378EEB07
MIDVDPRVDAPELLATQPPLDVGLRHPTGGQLGVARDPVLHEQMSPKQPSIVLTLLPRLPIIETLAHEAW